MFKASLEGKLEGWDNVVTRDQFDQLKDIDPLIAIAYSFGNGGRTYLWGHKIEKVKYLVSRMLAAPDMYTRRMAYTQFMRSLADMLYQSKTPSQTLEKVEKLQDLESVNRTQNLANTSRAKDLARHLTVLNLDYAEVPIPVNAVVYADPPYRGTDNQYNGMRFDFDRFDRWLSAVRFPVVVSEYTTPAGTVCIDRIRKRVLAVAGGSNKTAMEGLFIQTRYASRFKNKKEKARQGQELLF